MATRHLESWPKKRHLPVPFFLYMQVFANEMISPVFLSRASTSPRPFPGATSTVVTSISSPEDACEPAAMESNHIAQSKEEKYQLFQSHGTSGCNQ